MSSSRSHVLHQIQKSITQKLNVPYLDIYDSSYISADWHYPTDGRHYRPEINQYWFTSFYRDTKKQLAGTNSSSSSNGTTRRDIFDFHYTGYG